VIDANATVHGYTRILDASNGIDALRRVVVGVIHEQHRIPGGIIAELHAGEDSLHVGVVKLKAEFRTSNDPLTLEIRSLSYHERINHGCFTEQHCRGANIVHLCVDDTGGVAPVSHTFVS